MKTRFGLIAMLFGATLLLSGCGSKEEEAAPGGTEPVSKGTTPASGTPETTPAQPGASPGTAPAPTPGAPGGGGPAGDRVPPL